MPSRQVALKKDAIEDWPFFPRFFPGIEESSRISYKEKTMLFRKHDKETI